MSIVVIATIHPRPEHRAAVITALETTIAAVHDEPGVEVYALHEGEDRLVMIEQYASQELMAQHGKGENLANLIAAVDGKLTAPLDVQVLAPHPAGKPGLGTLR